MSYSYNGVSIIYSNNVSDNYFTEFQLQSELGEVFMNRTDIPGISASFTWNYPLRSWKSEDGNAIRIYAGTGAVAGYGNDLRKNAGLFFGLKGKIAADCFFKRNVRISISLSPILGCHMVNDGEYMRLEYYRNGLLNSLTPEIGVCYTF